MGYFGWVEGVGKLFWVGWVSGGGWSIILSRWEWVGKCSGWVVNGGGDWCWVEVGVGGCIA